MTSFSGRIGPMGVGLPLMLKLTKPMEGRGWLGYLSLGTGLTITCVRPYISNSAYVQCKI